MRASPKRCAELAAAGVRNRSSNSNTASGLGSWYGTYQRAYDPTYGPWLYVLVRDMRFPRALAMHVLLFIIQFPRYAVQGARFRDMRWTGSREAVPRYAVQVATFRQMRCTQHRQVRDMRWSNRPASRALSGRPATCW